MGTLTLDGISRRYGATTAVERVDLEVAEGEFVALLGPSGCGKTTTLRMVAGFVPPSSGRILIAGRDVTRAPPHGRDTGMVFQSYALFPHMTVGENVAFGLEMRRAARAEREARVREALRLARLEGLADRLPRQLSGGQQQRVALARAIVVNPTVLLCDEPLGALDKKLRQRMQFELKALHRRLGLTLLYVTHDQEEALTMSDRIAVMRSGRIAQLGLPGEIYDRPRSRFVADFIGDTNILTGEAEGGAMRLAGGWRVPLPAAASGTVAVALRPERVRLVAAGAGLVDAMVEESNFLGDSVLLQAALADGQTLLARVPRGTDAALLAPGARSGLAWDAADLVLLED